MRFQTTNEKKLIYPANYKRFGLIPEYVFVKCKKQVLRENVCVVSMCRMCERKVNELFYKTYA